MTLVYREVTKIQTMQIDLESHDQKSPTCTKDDHDDSSKHDMHDKQDEKSDSDDSSDSDSSSSSSSSSSNTRSSQDEEDEVAGMTKPRLSSSTSKSENSSLISRQNSVLIKHVHKIPLSGIFDPTFTELVDQFSLKVLEYLENVEKRLFIAELQKELRESSRCIVMKTVVIFTAS